MKLNHYLPYLATSLALSGVIWFGGWYLYTIQEMFVTTEILTFQNYLIFFTVAVNVSAMFLGYLLRPVAIKKEEALHDGLLTPEEAELLEDKKEPMPLKKSAETLRVEAAQAQLEALADPIPEETVLAATQGAQDRTEEPSQKETLELPNIGVPFDNKRKIYAEEVLNRYLNQQVAIASNEQLVKRIRNMEIKIDIDSLKEYGLKGVSVSVDKTQNGKSKNHIQTQIDPLEEIDTQQLED